MSDEPEPCPVCGSPYHSKREGHDHPRRCSHGHMVGGRCDGCIERADVVAWLRGMRDAAVPATTSAYAAGFHAAMELVGECIERGAHVGVAARAKGGAK